MAAASEERIRQITQRIYEDGRIELPGREPRALRMNISEKEGEMLRDLVARHKPQRTLEVGMGTGLSGLFICWGLLRAGAGGRHLAIDPYQCGHEWRGLGLQLRDHAGCTEMFEHCAELSEQALPRLVAAKRSFEFIFIDGLHLFEAALLDFYYSDKLLPIGGLCAFDDADTPQVWRVVNFARRHRNYEWVAGVPVPIGPLTRPWGWRNRLNRIRSFRQRGWSTREALRRSPHRLIVLRKTADNDRPYDFWTGLD